MEHSSKVISIIGHGIQSLDERREGKARWVRVVCPHCGKFVCKATPGSKVHFVCNRCKTESVTEVAA